MKILLILLMLSPIIACTTLGDVEKQALHDRAISDARNQPKEIHRAYLQCYALNNVDKSICKQRIKPHIQERRDATTWEYILPFDDQAERLGFKEFLGNNNQYCSSIPQQPIYDPKTDVYTIACDNNQQYVMRFDREAFKWKLLK